MTETGTFPACAFHPDRRAGVVCQRCDKPICPSCMNQASVGFHCPDCVRTGKQKVVHGRAAFGGLTTHTSTFTLTLIAANVLIFLVQATRPDVLTLGGRFNEVLYDFGLNGFLISEEGEWYRLFTSAFLHWNFIHLALNMFALWNLGPIVERSLGRARFAVIYAVGLMGGSAGAALVEPNGLTAGASGAIYGLLGALVILFRDRGISLWQSGLGLTLLINFAFTVGIPGISIGGHLGGLVGGLAATWILVEGSRRLRNPQLALLLAGSLILVFFAFGLWAATTWSDPLF